MQEYSVLPTRKYKFTAAHPRQFVTNYYTIKLNQIDSTIYQFAYFVTPEIENDSSKKLQDIVRNVWKEMVSKIGLISVRGNSLFGTKDTKAPLTFRSRMKNNDQVEQFEILVKKVKNLPIGDMLLSTNQYESKLAVQVLNVDTKERLRKMNMIELDKGKYYSKNKEITDNFLNGFILLKGSSFTAQKLKIGLSLHVELFSRLIRQRNVLEQIETCKSKDEIQSRLTNAIVITRYGNFRTYKVIDVDFGRSPTSKFIPCNQKDQTTYIEYYKKNYDIEITMKNQPLLHIVTKIEKVKRKGNISQKIIHEGYLIPELVSLVGLSEEHISNPFLMKQISYKTQMSAQKRIKETNTHIQNLNKQQGLYQIGEVKVANGYQLQQPIIQMKQRAFRAQNGEIKIEKQIVKQAAQFKHWYFITHKNHLDEAQELEKALRISSKAFGITIQQSVFYAIKDTKAEYWREDIEQQFEDLKENKEVFPQIVMVLIGGHLKDSIYHEIKNLCSIKYKVCTQFTTVSKVNMLNKKNCLLSYASSIILQMNCKIGKSIWEVPIRNPALAKKNIGICAIAISKNPSGFSLGFVGTINSKLSKVYNETKLKKRRVQFSSEIMSVIFINWLKSYYQFNGKKYLPEIIVFYRQGLNPSDSERNVKIEIEGMNLAINEAKTKTKITNYNPEIVYMSVNKRSTSRFYEQVNQNTHSSQKFTPKYANPQSGSIIVNELSGENVSSFNMISSYSPSNITSNPSEITFHYHHPARTPQEAFIELSFEQCFNYYNWKGAIKPPACLQNADKLAKLAGKSLKSDITCENELSKTFHFL